MSWTTAEDVRAQLQRRWDRGHLLVPPPGEPLFPLSLRFARPDARALSERFEEVRRWIRELQEGSKARLGYGYEVQWAEVNHRQLGANRVPSGLVIPTVADAVALIGKRRAAERFQQLVALTERACPSLGAWLGRRPLVALEHADDWERLLAVVSWFQRHPRPGVYLRQMDVAGADTKFVEGRRALIAQMLDEVLPADAVDRSCSPTRAFEERYGLRPKPALVRFRILDERAALEGLTDVATPLFELARLAPAVRRVFVTENETNGLAFPSLPDSMVIFGLGYGLEQLAQVPWLRDKAVHYWGDIDTHGFAMLDRVRAFLPQVRSVLMDRATLLEHRSLWGEEPEPYEGPLARLHESERRLYEALRSDELGPRVRLEQERISFSWAERAVRSVED